MPHVNKVTKWKTSVIASFTHHKTCFVQTYHQSRCKSPPSSNWPQLFLEVVFMFMFRSRWTGPRPPDAAGVAAPLCFRCYLLILASPYLFDGLSWNTVIAFPSATPVLSVKLILARNCFNWPPWDLKLKLQSNHRSQGSTLVKALRGKYKNYLLIYTVRHFSFFFLQANSEIMKPVRLVECSQHSCVRSSMGSSLYSAAAPQNKPSEDIFQIGLEKSGFLREAGTRGRVLSWLLSGFHVASCCSSEEHIELQCIKTDLLWH